MKTKKLHLIYYLLLNIFVLGLPCSAIAQNQSIKGTVTDNLGEPLVGATVIVKDSNIGVITSLDGTFVITVPTNNDTLEVSFVGYETTEIAIGSRTQIDIVLNGDSMQVEEVVVVGYGVQTKATVTGALSTVDPDELIKAPVASITNVLAGSVPGVSSVQTTGQPGADAAALYVRGVGSLNSSSPLVLVDGIERSFSQIDPNEIESFSVLKDAASTAVFGVRGANGVIVITTKRGTLGKPTISFSSNTGVQQPLGYMETVGSYEYATFWNNKMAVDGETNTMRYFSKEAVEAFRTGSDPIMYPNINWGDEIFNSAFLQTKNNLSISGGTEDVRYFVSMGYLFQDGVIKQIEALPYNNNYQYERYNYRANLDFKLTPTTSMKFNVGGNIGTTQSPNAIQGIDHIWTYTYLWTLPFAGAGIVDGQITNLADKFHYDNGDITRDGYSGFYGYGYKRDTQTTLNVDLDVTQDLGFITEGLTVSVKGGLDSWYNMIKNRTGGGIETRIVNYKSYLDSTLKPTTDLDYDKTLVYTPDGADTPLLYDVEYGKDRNWYLEGRLNYSKTFDNDHRVTALFLYNQSRDYYAETYGYLPKGYIGYVGRATYGYRGKYMLDVNVGYNGSENFAPGKTRYGLFPAVSAAWVVSEEPFMYNAEAISYLKLRASYGKVGSDQGGTRFMYMPATWNPSGSYSFGVDNATGSITSSYGIPGNSGVTWETSVKQNYGFDLMLFDDRLSLTAEYFFEDRSGILITPNSTPSLIATSLPSLNLGEVENQGYEVMLGWNDRPTKDFSYDVSLTASFARNRIIYMDEVQSEFAYQNSTGGSTGRQGLMYEYVRLYQYSDFTTNSSGEYILNPDLPQPYVNVAPGDAMYADLSGDGVVDADDMAYSGYSTLPEYIFGLNGGVSYKGFNLRMQWTGATNVDRMMEVEYRKPFGNSSMMGLIDYFYEDSWSDDNQGGTLPRAAADSEDWNSCASTLWLRDASYLRLKTLALGYNFASPKLKEKIGVESIGLTLSGYNLLTFSTLDFMDPESVATNVGVYPLVKIYSIGLDLKF